MRRFAILVLVACGSSRAPAPAPGGHVTPLDAALASAPAVDASQTCPATFGEASGHCVASKRCDYDAGTCICKPLVPREPCRGGAAVRPDEDAKSLAPPVPPPPPPPLTWQCTPAVRADGCPGDSPEGIGARCATDGKVCMYGDCCFHQFTCKDGTWQLTGGGCPP